MHRLLIAAAISAFTLTAYANSTADFVKRLEGFKSSTYKCAAGKKTIGYGFTAAHMITQGCISRTVADKELNRLCGDIVRQLRRELKGQRLTANEETAVVSFIYTVGWGGFKTSKIYHLLKQGKRGAAVAEEFRRWVYVDKDGQKVKSKGLQVRRLREAAMFARG